MAWAEGNDDVDDLDGGFAGCGEGGGEKGDVGLGVGEVGDNAHLDIHY